MKTSAALALSVAGILVTGSAALAVNTHVLNTTPAGTGNANSILLPSNPTRTPAPAAAVGAKAKANATTAANETPATPAKTTRTRESGEDKGGRRTTPSSTPGKGAAPGDDTDGTVPATSDAGSAGSQAAGTTRSQPGGAVGSQPAGTPAAGDPGVVSVQPGDDKGGLRTVPEPRDDKGGQRKASEPGDGRGGHGSDD